MRRKLLVVASVVAVIVTVPVLVYASHQFDDVPQSNTFHGDIAWLADNGITRGCNPPANTEFCPDDAVTRGQMAAFMRRFHNTFIAGSSGAVGLGSTGRSDGDSPSAGDGVVDGLVLNLEIPQAGALVVSASLDLENTMEADVFSCGLNTGGAVDTAQTDSWRVVDLSSDSYGTCSTDTALSVSPGTQIVRLVLSGAESTTLAYGGRLTAVLYTQDGSFGLLGEPSGDSSRARSVSDSPKAGQ